MKDKMKTKSKIKIAWPGLKRNQIDSSTILINGIFLTCIVLSVASGFIDLVYFSGLSKSNFHLGTWPIAASILYTVISIGLISGKFWCAMKIGMLRELQSRLKAKGKAWYKNITKALIPWHLVHKFLIGVSIVTSLSLSVNSIGAGIRTMEQNIKNMTLDANNLIELNKSVNEGVKENRDATKGSINGAKTAQQSVADSFDSKWKYVTEYRLKRDALDETAEDYETQKAALKKQYVSRAPEGVTNANIDWVEEYTIKNQLLDKAKKFEVVDSSLYIQESIEYDKTQIEDTLKALVDKEYKYPDGTLIQFVNEDGSLVNVQLAISRLQNCISAWQSDTGDVGESSKIFTLLATYMQAETTAGGMGMSEWMMIVFIALVGIVQEFLIAIFTPKANIDRKVLSQVSSYLEWKDEEEKERFLISVYKDYVGDGIINQEDFDAKVKKCVTLMEDTEEDIIAKYSKHTVKAPKAVKVRAEKPLPKIDTDVSPDYFESDELDELINKTEELIKK